MSKVTYSHVAPHFFIQHYNITGCDRRPISGAPTKFDQYTDNGHWRKLNCPGHYAYNPSDCDCSIKLEQGNRRNNNNNNNNDNKQ